MFDEHFGGAFSCVNLNHITIVYIIIFKRIFIDNFCLN